ncbi:MAG: hypothetical protein HS128_07180 [Ideonella sp.]|nr:hypothetical protein [Ideonella sp.]MCC7456804.1 hypothetical protein [Nitrospira sp.]
MPVIDLSSATFPAVEFRRIAAPSLVVTVAPNAVSKRQYWSGSPNYALAYSVGDAERRYAQAVADAVFSGAQFDQSPAAGQAELRLTSFTHLLIPRTTGSLPDVIDEVTAKWTLMSPAGTELRRFVFVGSESGVTRGGLAPAQAERGHVRARAAIQALFRHSVEGLISAPEIAQIGAR